MHIWLHPWHVYPIHLRSDSVNIGYTVSDGKKHKKPKGYFCSIATMYSDSRDSTYHQYTQSYRIRFFENGLQPSNGYFHSIKPWKTGRMAIHLNIKYPVLLPFQSFQQVPYRSSRIKLKLRWSCWPPPWGTWCKC